MLADDREIADFEPVATFRRKIERLSLFDTAAPATVHCKIVHFPSPKHF
jgi:hypothetical protein